MSWLVLSRLDGVINTSIGVAVMNLISSDCNAVGEDKREGYSLILGTVVSILDISLSRLALDMDLK